MNIVLRAERVKGNKQIVLVWRQETYISQAVQEFRRVVRGHFAKLAENQKFYENNS